MIDIRELPEHIAKIEMVVKQSTMEALSWIMEDLFNIIREKTIFDFQVWEIDQRIEDNSFVVEIRLPFESPKQDVYTALFWNNPTFENAPFVVSSSIDIHQPLQEAFEDFGIKCYPGEGEPIPPVKWPTPPETVVKLDANDFANVLEKYIDNVGIANTLAAIFKG